MEACVKKWSCLSGPLCTCFTYGRCVQTLVDEAWFCSCLVRGALYNEFLLQPAYGYRSSALSWCSRVRMGPLVLSAASLFSLFPPLPFPPLQSCSTVHLVKLLMCCVHLPRDLTAC